MNRRPASVTIAGWVYVAVGAIGFAYHFNELLARPFRYGALSVECVRLLAIVAGVFTLRGRNWARWLAIAWIGLHAILSAFHTAAEFAMHAAILFVIAWLLFRSDANRYFRAPRPQR